VPRFKPLTAPLDPCQVELLSPLHAPDFAACAGNPRPLLGAYFTALLWPRTLAEATQSAYVSVVANAATLHKAGGPADIT
jgi:hypothetical protein